MCNCSKTWLVSDQLGFELMSFSSEEPHMGFGIFESEAIFTLIRNEVE